MHRYVEVDRLIGCNVAALDRPAGPQRLRQQTKSLDDECTLLVTRTAAPQQAPQSLNPGVRVREQFAQRAPFAAVVKALNAAGSVTARSARTFRSTSMPAALRPAMKRL